MYCIYLNSQIAVQSEKVNLLIGITKFVKGSRSLQETKKIALKQTKQKNYSMLIIFISGYIICLNFNTPIRYTHIYNSVKKITIFFFVVCTSTAVCYVVLIISRRIESRYQDGNYSWIEVGIRFLYALYIMQKKKLPSL